MGFLVWILQLADTTRLGIVALIVAINCIVCGLCNYNVLKLYKTTKSPENALYRLHLFSQYIQGILVVVSTFFIFLMLMPFFVSYEVMGEVVCLLITMLLIVIILMIVNGIYYETVKKIRGITEKSITYAGERLKYILIGLVPFTIIVSIFMVLPHEVVEKGFTTVTGVIALILFVIIANAVSSLFYLRLLKAVPMEESELKNRLNMLVKKSGLKNTQIYNWPTKRRKIANAMIWGFKHKKIYVSDYFIENSSIDQIEAVLAHEIGHAKRHHNWINVLLGLAYVPIFALLINIIQYYEYINDTHISIVTYIIILAAFYIIYSRLITLFFSRIHEKQADAYVLKLEIDPQVYISALLLLSRLNNSVTKMNKLDEKFQTHPSIARRIRWIEQKSGITYNMVSESKQDSI